MNVLFLSTWFPYPSDNGSKLRVYYFLRALAQAHEVTFISFAFDTARPDTPGNLSAFCTSIHVVPLNPFIENKVGSIHTFLSLRPVASRPILAMQQLVDDVLRVHNFDIVIASTEMMADYVVQMPSGVSKILEEHNSMTRWMHERYIEQVNFLQQLRCWVSWQKTRYYEAKTFRQFDRVTMVSEQDRTACQSLPRYRGHVDVVPNGVDCAYNRPDLARVCSNILVYNGALTYSANYDAMRWFLAQIYPEIKVHIPDVSFTITGSVQGVDLAKLPMDDSVHLIGFVDDVRLSVAEAKVCVVPIRQGSGTRLKILEAMALGTPVVSTTKGAEGLEVVNNEHLLLADTPEAFVDAVLRVTRDSNLRERLRRNARALVVQRYDWENIGAQFTALVEETVEGPTGRPISPQRNR